MKKKKITQLFDRTTKNFLKILIYIELYIINCWGDWDYEY